MRLLVVEDEKDMNRIIVKELESEGYLVDSCYDGESAYDYLCMAEYDGAILDIMIPKMDGFTILKKVRSKGITTPILFLSAKSDVNDIVCGLDLGADDYMVKPFEFKELLARIRMITRKQVHAHCPKKANHIVRHTGIVFLPLRQIFDCLIKQFRSLLVQKFLCDFPVFHPVMIQKFFRLIP